MGIGYWHENKKISEKYDKETHTGTLSWHASVTSEEKPDCD